MSPEDLPQVVEWILHAEGISDIGFHFGAADQVGAKLVAYYRIDLKPRKILVLEVEGDAVTWNFYGRKKGRRVYASFVKTSRYSRRSQNA